MLLTSCTLRVDQLWPVFQNQASRQIFGYHNSPYIGYDEPRKVFKRSQDGQPTADAWVEQMVLNIDGKNSPVVLTLGTSSDDVDDTHEITNLASGEGFLVNVGEPVTHYRYVLYDSGCTDGCGNCPPADAAPLPALMLSAPAALVRLERPVRSASDLVEHATILLSRFDLPELDPVAWSRIEGWAEAILATGDVTYAQILDDPRVDLSYDPTSDLLRITNRAALERATPAPSDEVDDPPDLRETLQLEAEALRDELQTMPGALEHLGETFELSTRAVGYGGADGTSVGPIPFEYVFTLPGRLEDLALPDRHLGIGVTRLGELATITVSTVDVEVVGTVGLQRSPEQALELLEAVVLEQYPAALDIELVAPTVGYQLGEGETSSELEPSLLVGYVLEFGPAADPVVSRRVPVRISLAQADAAIEPLGAVDPDDREGDDHAAN